MTAKNRVTRLEAAQRRRPVVTPSYDLSALTEDEVRYMIAMYEKDGALTEDERAAVVAIDAKVKVVK